MSVASVIYKAPHTLQLVGELDFNSVVSLQAQVEQYLQHQVIDTIDLKELSQSNSAGLALLLEWQRMALQKMSTFKFINMPARMQAAAKLYGVAELFILERD